MVYKYHIADRDEGDNDADDESGSRSYPSRTYWGQKWELCKDFPWLAQPFRIFGIAITPPFYYLDNLTLAQVAIMASDRSIIVYDKKKTKGKDASGRDIEFEAPSRNAINDAAKRWAERNNHIKSQLNNSNNNE